MPKSVNDNFLGRRGMATRPVYELVGNCWLSTGADNGYGYALMNGTGAHRCAYREYHGWIPEGAHIHHMCGMRRCIHRDHIIAVSATDHAKIHKFQRELERQFL